MKAVVFHGVGDIRLEDVKEPQIEQDTDAIVRITASAICGTDLHFIRGSMGEMKSGTILGHEGLGIIEELGSGVRNFKVGDRVVIPSTIACGYCSYCRAGFHSQCDVANPNGRDKGTPFFGGPKSSGPFQGLQAEYARVPFAHVGLVKIPEEVSDDDAILISDIFPTGYFGADNAEIKGGDTVAVFGCGPVGQFAIASAKLKNAIRIFAIDMLEDRLEMAARQGAETIHFEKEDPVQTLRELTGGIGVDRAIDAVGVDAYHPHEGPARKSFRESAGKFKQEVEEIHSDDSQKILEGLNPGDAPSQVLRWAIRGLAKAGTLSIIGVYGEKDIFFPMGEAMGKNLTFQMGNCNHRFYIPKLLNFVKIGLIKPSEVLTQHSKMESILDAYQAFEAHSKGWIKVMIDLKQAA